MFFCFFLFQSIFFIFQKNPLKTPVKSPPDQFSLCPENNSHRAPQDGAQWEFWLFKYFVIFYYYNDEKYVWTAGNWKIRFWTSYIHLYFFKMYENVKIMRDRKLKFFVCPIVPRSPQGNFWRKWPRFFSWVTQKRRHVSFQTRFRK